MGDIVSNLTGHWKMDGNLNDSVGTNHGTLTAGSATYVTGKVGQALQLDGQAGQYVDIGVAISNFISASAATIALWVRISGTPISATVSYDLAPLAYETSKFIGIFWGDRTSGSPTGDFIWVYNWDTNADDINILYTQDVWTHVALTHGGGTLSAYKDGSFVNSVASGNTGAVSGSFRLHRESDAETDDIRTYDRELSADDISDLYALGSSGSANSSPNYYYRAAG